MSEHVESVKDAMRLVRKSAESLKERQPDVATERSFLVGRLERAIDHMLHLEGLTSALPPELGNILDLPQELRDELSVAKTDELEDQIVTVINAYGGEASLDQILVGLYRKFKVMQKRRFIQNKLYRMEMVWSVEGRKGVYTTKEPEIQSLDDDPAPIRSTRDLDSEIPF